MVLGCRVSGAGRFCRHKTLYTLGSRRHALGETVPRAARSEHRCWRAGTVPLAVHSVYYGNLADPGNHPCNIGVQIKVFVRAANAYQSAPYPGCVMQVQKQNKL